jgi:hypothetical protein
MGAGGRPRKYRSAKQVQQIIDEYFAGQDARERPYTITGLALALGLDRPQLLSYGRTDEFYNTIKEAKAKVQSSVEEKLLMQGAPAAGVIFNLKNNFGWRDKTETEVSGQMGLNITVAFEGPDQDE